MLSVKLLGQFSIERDGTPVDLPSRPAQALLAYLILNASSAHRREKLAGLIWPDATDANARSNLRHALWRIRKALGADCIEADDISVAFSTRVTYALDVARLERPTRPDTPADALIDAVSAYTGEFLPGFYDDWIALERERLQALFERQIDALIDRLLAEQRWREVVDWAERWLALGQVPETAYRALMTAHFYLGNMSQVAAVYQRCVETLRTELDVEPSDRTRALYQQLSKNLPADHGRLPAASAAPIDLPRSTRAAHHNLPPQATPFVGRQAELAEITHRLRADPDCRLLTLAGPGGIGKTRLAIQAAQDCLNDFADGVWFVALAPLTSPQQIVAAIAQATGLIFHAPADPRTQLIDYLREKHLLLIIDNSEHLLSGLDVLGDVLAAAPRVKLLVTSRERLHLQWEWLLEIQGLDYPAADDDPAAEYSSAVQLFLQTTRRVAPHFSFAEERTHVIRICQLVDGMPLGIELAAAWVRVLACQDIAQQIEHNLDLLATAAPDRPARQRSLRAAFEYSWHLLSPEEQFAYKKLAVFHGGFRREAAEKVAGAPLSLLFTLLDKSLLRRSSSGRFDMHTVLRQYVAEKLAQGADQVDASGVVQVTQTRLAQYYLGFARQHRADYAALDEEWVNLRTGLQLAHDQAMWQTVLAYAESLQAASFALGRFTDVRLSSPWVLAAAQALADQPAMAACWRQWGRACIEQGDYTEAAQHLQRGLELARRLGDESGVASGQFGLARIALEQGDNARAEELLIACQAIYDRLEDSIGLGKVLFQRANVQFNYQHWVAADDLAQRALAIQQAADAPDDVLATLHLLADIALHGMADYARAEEYCRRALALCDERRNLGERAAALHTLAEVHRLQARTDEARQEAEASLKLFKVMGDRQSQARALYRLSLLDADVKDYAGARDTGEQSLMLCRQLHDRWGLVYVAYHLSEVYMQLRAEAQAHELRAEALSLAQELNHPLIDVLRERAS